MADERFRAGRFLVFTLQQRDRAVKISMAPSQTQETHETMASR